MKYEKYETAFEPIWIPIAEDFRDVCKLISSDYYRIYEKELSVWGCIGRLLKCDYLAWFRWGQTKTIFRPLIRLVFHLSSYHAGIEMRWNAKIGYGLYMGHRRFIFMCGVIGNNVSVSQFTNFGTNKGTPVKVCDGAYLAPMVCTIEDVTIGKQSIVGAGSVVVKNVPSFSTAVGSPAKKINDHYNKVWHEYPLPQELVDKIGV